MAARRRGGKGDKESKSGEKLLKGQDDREIEQRGKTGGEKG